MLGVVNEHHPIADDAYAPTLPDSLARLLTKRSSYTAWGDFYVCPVAPARAGWMRFVVVRKARRVFAMPR